LRREGVLGAFFAFLAPEAFSVHSMHVCQLLLEHCAVQPLQLAQMGVPRSVRPLSPFSVPT
jgi:hypothetical protein